MNDKQMEASPADATMRPEDDPAPGKITGGLDAAIKRALDGLVAEQHPDGYWCYEFEADCTIPAEYILMMHFMNEIDAGLEQKIAVYLRSRQGEDGGWPLYFGGPLNISCTVKTYYALKIAGDICIYTNHNRTIEQLDF